MKNLELGLRLPRRPDKSGLLAMRFFDGFVASAEMTTPCRVRG
jgi:hypothetical protein